jgi:hypothetical protein
MIDLTDMLRVRHYRTHGVVVDRFVLYRWQPHHWREEGIYKPISRPMSAEHMKDMLEGMELDAATVARFVDYSGSLSEQSHGGAQSRPIPLDTSPRKPVPLPTEPEA